MQRWAVGLVKVLFFVLLVVALGIGSMPLFAAAAVPLVLYWATQAWMRHTVANLRIGRSCAGHLFHGESTACTVQIHNRGRLPIPWLMIQHRLGIALGACRSTTITFQITGLRRGVHALGPMGLRMGDVLGIVQRDLEAPLRQYLIVYPHLLSPTLVETPSVIPYGNRPARRRILGDPTQVLGIRDYIPGDPVRHIHWRATAATGTLQVKQHQPTTTLQSVIFLDLQPVSFLAGGTQRVTELAISVAATIAQAQIAGRQEVGLVSNGRLNLLDEEPDPDAGGHNPRLPGPAGGTSHTKEPGDAGPSAARQLVAPIPSLQWRPPTLLRLLAGDQWPLARPLPPAGGRAQLLTLLETLARLEGHPEPAPLSALLTRHGLNLPWGSTAMVVAHKVDEAALLAMRRLREAGLQVMLYAVGRQADPQTLAARARVLGLHLRFVPSEREGGDPG